ncbi:MULTISPECIES: mechanosensitive ion channel family protein [Sutcliffiella]|nr:MULTISPECIES: mechanosensitive ion channel family protein [Sutcliffiella]MED4015037.1 mechanosensitive ion channel family protein [Sutcliffiella cohnii]WBL17234.1 mechanosensitive ion channel family protein [Sutcliffiella sp. NC1]
MTKIIDSFMETYTYEFWTDTELWTDIGISVGILLLFLLFRKLFTRYVFKLVLSLSRKVPTDIFSYIVVAFEKPIRTLFVVIGIYFALITAPFELIKLATANKILQTVIGILFTWGIFNFIPSSFKLFTSFTNRIDYQLDQIVIPFLTKVVRAILIGLALSLTLDLWGYNVSGFVAGLGLGGLAFALAAQETLKNLLGGFIIVTEKPFSIGEWIKTPSVEGTVEDITFRSTKVRTFAQAVVTVPNSVLSNEAIINWSKMGKRQIQFQLGVQYDTPREKLETVVRRIESLLQNHDDVHQETIMVRFDNFGDSSLNVFLYFFTKTTVWAEFLRVKEDINFKIMEILEEEGVQVAFPTRTLHISSMPNEEERKEYSVQ